MDKDLVTVSSSFSAYKRRLLILKTTALSFSRYHLIIIANANAEYIMSLLSKPPIPVLRRYCTGLFCNYYYIVDITKYVLVGIHKNIPFYLAKTYLIQLTILTLVENNSSSENVPVPNRY